MMGGWCGPDPARNRCLDKGSMSGRATVRLADGIDDDIETFPDRISELAFGPKSHVAVGVVRQGFVRDSLTLEVSSRLGRDRNASE